MEPSPASPRRRVRTAVSVLLGLVLTSGCTGALRESAPEPTEPDEPVVETLRDWPDDEPVATTTSPAHPDVEVGVRPLLREPDGTTTALVDVTNASPEDLDLGRIFGDAGMAGASVVDPQSRRRHAPVISSSTSHCLCSSNVSAVPAGSTTTAYMTFTGVATDVDAMRLSLPEWRPVEDVPVRPVEVAARKTAGTTIEADPDLVVTIGGVWRTDDGLLVRVEERNESAEDRYPSQMADLTELVVVDAATLRAGRVRQAELRSVIEPSPDGGLPAGASATRDVLVSAPAGDPDAVLVRIPSTRRTLPIAVQDDAPSTELSTNGLDPDRTLALEGAVVTESSAVVDLGEPDEPGPSVAGPAIDLPEALPALTSPAQPGWSVAPRAVVRTSEARSALYLDIERGDEDAGWPDGLGSALEEIALIDTEEQLRSGPLEGSGGTDGSSDGVQVPRRGRRTAHVAFPAVAPGTEVVSVDLPGFGAVAGVPVIEGADPATPEDEILASLADDSSGRLRTDVLAVGRLPGDAGVLVRIRRVNVSATEAYSPDGGPCGLSLSDADSDRRVLPLAPCVATTWSRPLAVGESLVEEVRFPTLPADVERVVVEDDGWLGSPPVPVGDDVAPWYLDLPRAADSPQGDTLAASVGVADDLQTELRDGDEVDLNLDTDVLFSFGSADLTPDAVTRLEGVGERLAVEVASGTLTVVGHTDDVGDEPTNIALSEARAQAVADALRPRLPGAVEIAVEGRGESDPIAPNEVDGRDDPDGRQRNRRVTVSYTA